MHAGKNMWKNDKQPGVHHFFKNGELMSKDFDFPVPVHKHHQHVKNDAVMHDCHTHPLHIASKHHQDIIKNEEQKWYGLSNPPRLYHLSNRLLPIACSTTIIRVHLISQILRFCDPLLSCVKLHGYVVGDTATIVIHICCNSSCNMTCNMHVHGTVWQSLIFMTLRKFNNTSSLFLWLLDHRQLLPRWYW